MLKETSRIGARGGKPKDAVMPLTVRRWNGGWAVFDARRERVSAQSSTRDEAEDRAEELEEYLIERDNSKPRKCLGPYCGATFMSTGPGNRLCPSCKGLIETSFTSPHAVLRG